MMLRFSAVLALTLALGGCMPQYSDDMSMLLASTASHPHGVVPPADDPSRFAYGGGYYYDPNAPHGEE